MYHSSGYRNHMKPFLTMKLQSAPNFFNISSNDNTSGGNKSMAPSEYLSVKSTGMTVVSFLFFDHQHNKYINEKCIS